jgi:D-sedoheptulose 7-phosphate isomerase
LHKGLGVEDVNLSSTTKVSLERERVTTQLRESADLKLKVAEECIGQILRASEIIADRLLRGGKLLLCGNGGSAADSQHLASEFVNVLTKKNLRPPMAAVALTTDTSVLTAWGNDFGFGRVFERQIFALGRPDDVLLVITTSGRSENVIKAVKAASEVGMATVGLLGQGGGAVSPLVDVAITVPSNDVQRIQESQITIGHIICDLVERMVYSEPEGGRK